MMHAIRQGLALSLLVLLAGTTVLPAYAGDENASNQHPKGRISGRSVLAGATSLLIWPGIGQAINDNRGKKVVSHAVLGLLPPYRIWSAYDATVDRKGGYLKGRI